MIEIPLLGKLEPDQLGDWLRSQPISVNVLGGALFEFVLEGYETDEKKEDFHQAISNFLSLDVEVLKKSEDAIFLYCKEMMAIGDEWYGKINKANDVWEHIQFTQRPHVIRDRHGKKLVYISLECSCVWDVEHGLQIVFRQGLLVNKVGQYDGDLENYDNNGNVSDRLIML